MTYLIQQFKKPPKKKRFWLLFLLFLTALIVFLTFVSPVRSAIWGFFSPFLKAGDSFYFNSDKILGFFRDKNQLIEGNQKLLGEIESCHSDALDYEVVKRENVRLRSELAIRPAANFVAASIVARPPQIPLDTLFLDVGTLLGVKKGDLVLVSERVIIGKIAETSQNKSTVILNSFAGAISYGYVARTNEPIEIKGNGGSSLEAKVPIDFDVVVGDEIILGGSFDYFAAAVGLVEEDQSSGFKKVLMSLPLDVSRVSLVFIQPLLNE